MILDAYLNAFAKACQRAGGWYALDLFAGTGLNWSTTRNAPIDGSALIALGAEPPDATTVVLAEKHPGAFDALTHRTERFGDRALRFNDDANGVIADMLAPIPRRAPAFAFLDPEGSELEWETVDAIAEHKRGHSPFKVEQLILFPTDMGFVRLAPDHPELVTRIYGHAVLRRAPHDVENVMDELLRDPFVEEVAHRIDEDQPRALPTQRLLQPGRPDAKVEPLLVGMAGDPAPALSERLGVAVSAAGRHLVAPGHGVPRRLRPLDRAAVSHASAPYSPCPSNRCSPLGRTFLLPSRQERTPP